MIRLETILHPTDFSESSRYALELGCAIARDQFARVLLLHVLPRPQRSRTAELSGVKSQHTEEDLKAYRDEMAGLLARARESAPYARVESMLKEGPVAGTIVRTAAEHACDLIVMGCHGQAHLPLVMMGNVAAAVTRVATCPVVTVSRPRHNHA